MWHVRRWCIFVVEYDAPMHHHHHASRFKRHKSRFKVQATQISLVAYASLTRDFSFHLFNRQGKLVFFPIGHCNDTKGRLLPRDFILFRY